MYLINFGAKPTDGWIELDEESVNNPILNHLKLIKDSI